MNHNVCKICGKKNEHSEINIKERMLGTLDEFKYFQCHSCQCLQITQTPINLEKYYPNNYYSYKNLDRLIDAPFRKWVDTHRVRQLIYDRNITGYILDKISKPLDYMPWIRDANLQRDSKILDVGCGQGRLLHRMALGGFTNLTGIDPFIKENVHYQNGVKIIKTNLDEFVIGDSYYDFIMLHHSLEHMPDQHIAMRSISKLLTPDGIALIRIPLADSYAWEHYREHWVQLDAPRHLYLHSNTSLALLASKNNLNIESIVYDSSRFQFTGSELYLRDIPLSSDKKTRDIFTNKQLKAFDDKAMELNQSARGDQAAFYLKSSHI